MSRTEFYIVAILTSALLAGCGSPETPARAETVSAGPVSTPPVAVAGPDAVATSEQGGAPTGLSARAPDALERLKAQLNEIAAEPAKDVATAMPAPAAETPAPSAVPHSVEELHGEVKELRREVARLQETVDAALAYLVGELGDENRRMKKDIVPQSDIDQAGEIPDASQPGPAVAATPAVPHVDYGKDGYLSVKEWGRTPEQAKELGGGVSSLRGMICAVSPGSSDEELKAIGKKLRGLCVGYDNINIDVFDDEAAARDYSDRNVRSNEHFVMNITRHKASGQDVTVLVRGNGAREVVLE